MWKILWSTRFEWDCCKRAWCTTLRVVSNHINIQHEAGNSLHHLWKCWPSACVATRSSSPCFIHAGSQICTQESRRIVRSWGESWMKTLRSVFQQLPLDLQKLRGDVWGKDGQTVKYYIHDVRVNNQHLMPRLEDDPVWQKRCVEIVELHWL